MDWKLEADNGKTVHFGTQKDHFYFEKQKFPYSRKTCFLEIQKVLARECSKNMTEELAFELRAAWRKETGYSTPLGEYLKGGGNPHGGKVITPADIDRMMGF